MGTQKSFWNSRWCLIDELWIIVAMTQPLLGPTSGNEILLNMILSVWTNLDLFKNTQSGGKTLLQLLRIHSTSALYTWLFPGFLSELSMWLLSNRFYWTWILKCMYMQNTLQIVNLEKFQQVVMGSYFKVMKSLQEQFHANYFIVPCTLWMPTLLYFKTSRSNPYRYKCSILY